MSIDGNIQNDTNEEPPRDDWRKKVEESSAQTTEVTASLESFASDAKAVPSKVISSKESRKMLFRLGAPLPLFLTQIMLVYGFWPRSRRRSGRRGVALDLLPWLLRWQPNGLSEPLIGSRRLGDLSMPFTSQTVLLFPLSRAPFLERCFSLLFRIPWIAGFYDKMLNSVLFVKYGAPHHSTPRGSSWSSDYGSAKRIEPERTGERARDCRIDGTSKKMQSGQEKYFPIERRERPQGRKATGKQDEATYKKSDTRWLSELARGV